MFNCLFSTLTVQRLSAKDAPALMLGIYQVITGSCVFTDQSKKVTVSYML